MPRRPPGLLMLGVAWSAIMRMILTRSLLFGLGLLLVGCATDDYGATSRQVKQGAVSTVQAKDDPALKSIPVRERIPESPKSTSKAETPSVPKSPTLAEALQGKQLVSPWTSVSPVQGSWVWANDASFIVIFGADGSLRYGPSIVGIYQLLDAQTLRYQLMQMNGQPMPGQGPQDWKIGLFEQGAVLVLMREQVAMVFKRM